MLLLLGFNWYFNLTTFVTGFNLLAEGYFKFLTSAPDTDKRSFVIVKRMRI